MEQGWIKVHRKIRQHWIWDNSDYLKWWLDLIISANYKPVKVLINNEPTSIERGMYHTSEVKLAKRWQVNRKTVNSFLKKLETDSMVTIKKSRRNGTIIELCNYEAYQEVFGSEGTTEDTTEGTTEDTTEGTTEDTTEGTTEDTTEVTIEETTEGTTEDTTEVTTEDTTERTTEDTTEVTIEETTEGATEDTTEGATEDTTEVTIEGTTEGQDAGHQKDNAQGGYTQVLIPANALSDANSRKQPKGEKTKRCMSKQMQDAFDFFWAEYPRKVNKGDARKAWKQIQPSSELLTKIIIALKRAKTSFGWKKDGGQYIPYPATWLRAEGWEDEAYPVAPEQKFTQTASRREI